jgi:hypothetical protein
MKENLKHNLTAWGIYAAIMIVVLIPVLGWAAISYGIILGGFMGILNSIYQRLKLIYYELRHLNKTVDESNQQSSPHIDTLGD